MRATLAEAGWIGLTAGRPTTERPARKAAIASRSAWWTSSAGAASGRSWWRRIWVIRQRRVSSSRSSSVGSGRSRLWWLRTVETSSCHCSRHLRRNSIGISPSMPARSPFSSRSLPTAYPTGTDAWSHSPATRSPTTSPMGSARPRLTASQGCCAGAGRRGIRANCINRGPTRDRLDPTSSSEPARTPWADRLTQDAPTWRFLLSPRVAGSPASSLDGSLRTRSARFG